MIFCVLFALSLTPEPGALPYLTPVSPTRWGYNVGLSHRTVSPSMSCSAIGSNHAQIPRASQRHLVSRSSCGSRSAVSVLTITVLLSLYNGLPVEDWNVVTLNAVFHVFSTMCKSLIAYSVNEAHGQAKWLWLSRKTRPVEDLDIIDDASRGSEGSLKLLCQSVARSWISIGALIIV